MCDTLFHVDELYRKTHLRHQVLLMILPKQRFWPLTHCVIGVCRSRVYPRNSSESQISFAHNFFNQLLNCFRNFAQSTAVILPCSVQNSSESQISFAHNCLNHLLNCFCNFAQSTAVILPCSVKITKRLGNWCGSHEQRCFCVICQWLRWDSEGYVMVQCSAPYVWMPLSR